MKTIIGIFLISILINYSSAQTVTLNGVIYSEKGARIIGTKVNFIKTTGEKRTTGVNQEGAYEISLPLGIYRIDFIKAGFESLTIPRYQIVRTDSGIMCLDVVLERAK